jgi:hypothetical protein
LSAYHGSEILRLKSLDRVRDITCSDDVAFEFDGAFDDCNVESVWNQRNDEIVCRNSFIEFFNRSHIDRFRSGVFEVST